MHAHSSARRSALLRFARLAVALIVAAILPVIAIHRAEANAVPVSYGTTPSLKADRILILKSQRKLELLRNGFVLRSFPIALGPAPRGPKQALGDGRTPEGVYFVDGRLAHSAYHLALHVSYPNAEDVARATAAHRDPGGDIEIHGLPNWYHRPDPVRFPKDWTSGCISVGNAAIEQIWAAVDDGTPIEIRP